MIIYLSAIETGFEHLSTVIRNEVPHVLTSFLYAGWKGTASRTPLWTKAMQQAKIRLIDSGAHSFRTAHFDSGAVSGVADLDEFAHAYIKWLLNVKRQRLADWWVELDIGAMSGQPWVNKTRKKFVDSGLGGGLIQVWHSSEHDWDYWLWLLRESTRPGRSRYVAIEGHGQGRDRHDYTKFLHEAYKRGVRVHGFKLTGAQDLQKWPFYSVDSTSWLVTMHAGGLPAIHVTGGATQVRNGINSGGMSGRRTKWYGGFPRYQPKKWRQDILNVSCKMWLREEEKIDALWKLRGVDWEQAIINPEVRDDDGTDHPLARLG
jgi:hypothetical protein